MSDIVERLRNLESAAADEAANLIEALRKANAEVMATGIKSVRDVAELAIELRETKAERDKMARQLDEYRESFANMARERDLLWEDLTQVTIERDEARLQMGRILNEIDCRIEHGAESNGHLEAIYNLFKENSNV